MLFRKTFRNAAAALLGLALALATGTAHAVINLDATGAAPVGTVPFSRETVDRTAVLIGTSSFRIYPSGDPTALRVEGTVGVRGDDNRQIFVRYDLGNMVWWGNIGTGVVSIPDKDTAATGVQATTSEPILESGGRPGQNFAIFSWPDNEEVSIDAKVVAAFHNQLAMQPGLIGGPGTIRQSTFLALTDALAANRQPLVSKSADVVELVSSVRHVVTPGEVTAAVANGFLQFRSAGRNTIGALTVSIGGSTREPHYSATDGSEVTELGQVMTAANAARTSGSLVTFRGNFSVGSFYANVGATASCGAGAALTTKNATTGAVYDTVTAAVEKGITSFCVDVLATNADQIPVGEYWVSTTYAGIANAAYPPMSLAETRIGRIKRDGTEVHIPYLTTYTGYNQRVVIVNRNSAPVSYAFSFTAEEGNTAAPGAMASGSVPGDRTMVINARDIVTVTGDKTRTAATLSVVATAGSVDIATTQVNLDTQGTDTVVYENTAL